MEFTGGSKLLEAVSGDVVDWEGADGVDEVWLEPSFFGGPASDE